MSLAIANGGASSATVMAGGTAYYSLMIGGSGFSGQTSMTCSGAPTGATCSVNPANPMVSAETPALLTVSVSTTARTSASLPRLSGVSPWMWAIVLFGFFALPGSTRATRLKLLLILVFLVPLSMSSCGGNGAKNKPIGTPAGTIKFRFRPRPAERVPFIAAYGRIARRSSYSEVSRNLHFWSVLPQGDFTSGRHENSLASGLMSDKRGVT